MGNCCSSSIEEDENEPLLYKGKKLKSGVSLNTDTIIPETVTEDEPSVDIVTISATTEKDDPNQEMVDRVISKFVGVDDTDDYDYDDSAMNNNELPIEQVKIALSNHPDLCVTRTVENSSSEFEALQSMSDAVETTKLIASAIENISVESNEMIVIEF